MNSVLSGLSFNLFANMKFGMLFRQFLSFGIEWEKFSGESVMYSWVSSA